jgi:RHS repeat-associated protein
VTNLLESSTRTYDYGTTHPAAVIEVEEADSTPTVTGTDLFAYDDVGRMVSRDTATGEMTLTWDVSSNLVKTVEDDETVLYAYDGSGQRVARIEATTATAYLGSVEVADPDTDPEVTGNLEATRFYTLGGATVATRTATSLSFLFGDHQGSAEVLVTHPIQQDSTLDLETPPTVTRNAYTPYGTTRDTDQLSIDHGWLNQISDETDTGLIYLNARYYDPVLSRFLSPDPLMNPGNPNTLDPYMYSADNPISFSDPSGSWYCAPGQWYSNCIAANNNPVNPSTGLSLTQQNQNLAQTANTSGGTYTEPFSIPSVNDLLGLYPVIYDQLLHEAKTWEGTKNDNIPAWMPLSDFMWMSQLPPGLLAAAGTAAERSPSLIPTLLTSVRASVRNNGYWRYLPDTWTFSRSLWFGKTGPEAHSKISAAGKWGKGANVVGVGYTFVDSFYGVYGDSPAGERWAGSIARTGFVSGSAWLAGATAFVGCGAGPWALICAGVASLGAGWGAMQAWDTFAAPGDSMSLSWDQLKTYAKLDEDQQLVYRYVYALNGGG